MMSATSEFLSRSENRSVAAVVFLTVAALAIGWQLRLAVVDATRPVEVGNLSARVPDGWLVQEGVADLALAARSPARDLPRFTVSRLPAADSLEEIAEMRTAERGRLLSGLEIVDATEDSVGEREVYRVRYSYVDESGNGTPDLVEGLDEYFALGGEVLVASLETEAGSMADSLPRFSKFVESIELLSGPGP